MKKKVNTRTMVTRTVFGLVFAAIALTIAWGVQVVFNATEAPHAIGIVVEKDTDRDAFKQLLVNHLGQSMGVDVYRMWRLQGATIHPGYYEVGPDESAWQVGRRLAKGRQTPVKVVLNNARTLDDVARQVSARMGFDKYDFLTAADSVLPSRGYRGREQFPAAFVPDNYEFYHSASPVKVINRMADVRDRFWTPARRQKAADLGLTPVEAATVASIVEEESNDQADRPVIARLYLNRLKKGMRLQADPTVRYALGDFTLRRIGGKQLQVASPYNTYRVQGLPPGPIRVPERRTIDQVLDAPANDYLYMCASPQFDGKHRFAADYATHQRNARDYQQALDQRGIRL